MGGVITDNVLWACTMCRWCVDACPVFIEHVPKIVDMRRWLVLTESRFPAELQPAFRNLETNGNPWQMSWQTRTAWAEDLGVRLMSDVHEAEYLYWVGCYGSFDERNKKVARAFVKLLQAAQVDFAILGNEEKCTGEPARRLGHEYLYQTLAQGNIETLKRYRFQTIVTACPHCFNTIRNEYPDFDGHFRVIHHSQLLDDLVRGRTLARVAGRNRADHLSRRVQSRPVQRRVRRTSTGARVDDADRSWPRCNSADRGDSAAGAAAAASGWRSRRAAA